MKKKILSLLLVLGLFLSGTILFTACGEPKEKQAISLTYVNASGEEIYSYNTYTYSKNLNVDIYDNVFVKLTYDDGSTNTFDFDDKQFAITIEYAPFGDNVTTETLQSLPSSDSYKVGMYTIKHFYQKVGAGINFTVEQANYGANYALTSIGTSGWDYIQAPTLEDLIESAVVVDSEGNELQLDMSDGYPFSYMNIDKFNEIKASINYTTTGYSLPDTEQVQSLIEQNSKTYDNYTEIYPGDYVFFASIEGSDNYGSVYTTKGVKVSVVKTILFVSSETQNNVVRTYDLNYETFEEVQNGIAISKIFDTNSYATGDNVVLKDNHGNSYTFDYFDLTTNWAFGTPTTVNYNDEIKSYPLQFVSTTICQDNGETHKADGFDITNIYAKIGINIEPVIIRTTLFERSYTYQEYLNTTNKNNFRIVVDDLGLEVIEGADTANYVNFEVKKDGNAVPSDVTVVYSNNNYYINIPQSSIDLGTYEAIITPKYPNSCIIQKGTYSADQQTTTIVVANPEIDIEIVNSTIDPDGKITMEWAVRSLNTLESGYSYLADTNIFNNFTWSPVDKALEIQDYLGTATLSNVEFTQKIGNQMGFDSSYVKNEDVLLITMTATVTNLTHEFSNGVNLRIQANSTSKFYNNLNSIVYFSTDQYILSQDDYITKLLGGKLNQSTTETLKSEETFTLDTYINTNTLNNDYGKWVITKDGQEVTDYSEEVTETTTFVITFEPKNEVAVRSIEPIQLKIIVSQ